MLQVVPIEEAKQWREIVRRFTDWDIYYLPEYVKAFQVHGDGEPLLFYYESSSLQVMNVVMKRDVADDLRFQGKIPPKTYYDLVTPYGYGGGVAEGEKEATELKKYKAAYEAYCARQGIVSEFVRFHPLMGNARDMAELYQIQSLGATVAIEMQSAEQIWEDFSSANRNKIRKAQKNGVTIFWGRSAELLQQFHCMYNGTMDKDQAKPYYYFGDEFYNSILEDLKHHFLIFYAVCQGKMAAMSLILFANQQLHYHLSASDPAFNFVAPTNLLIYESALWGLENGFQSLHLGGGLGSRMDELYRFKKTFNKQKDLEFAVGRRIFFEESYNELVEIRKNSTPDFDSSAAFFPLYRA